MEEASPAGFEEVAVVSCDIRGHTGANSTDQVRRVVAINDIVQSAIRRGRPGKVVWSSGGDGGHVVFRGDHWQANALTLIRQLVEWSRGEGVQLRITGHVGEVTSVVGADGRLQVVGTGINFAGWLLGQFNREAVVVSDAFRRAVAPAPAAKAVGFHHERLHFDRNSEPQLLFLVSLGEYESSWPEEPDDYVSLQECVRRGSGWDVLYYAKRIWQVNAKDQQVVAALERAARMLKSENLDEESFLEGLRYDELTEMLKLGQLVERRPGEVICRYGEPGESLFVILRGQVGVYNIEGRGLDSTATAKHLHRAGEVVGELASALKRTRTADLIAVTDVALLSFNSEEVRGKLSDTVAGEAAARQFELFIVKRVLEHTSQVASYLLGPNRSGPLSIEAAPTHPRVGGEEAWRGALRTLRPHCALITVDTVSDTLELEDMPEAPGGRHGLYVLVSGSLRSAGSARTELHGSRCPVLWVDLPDLLSLPPDSYSRTKDSVMVLRIGAEGIDRLPRDQRVELRAALEGVVGHLPDSYEYDVYLCYSSADKDVVREIRDRLARHRIRCWFDDDELRAGDLVRHRMEQGLRSSKFLLVCASANLPDARWANFEINSVLYLDVQRQDEPKVLVLKLNERDTEEASIPLLLRGHKWHHYERPGDFERLVEFLRTSR